MPTTEEIAGIIADGSLSDDQKATRLGIPVEEYRERLAGGYYRPMESGATPTTTARGTPSPEPGPGKINPDTVRSIVNDSSLTDAVKAERLGISQAAYEQHQAALSADPAAVEQDLLNAQEGHRKSLEVDLSKGKDNADPLRPTFEAGGDGRRQHALLMEYEAKKQSEITGKTTDARRAFTPAEQQAYNNYAGDVPVKNIWDWADKIEAGTLPAPDDFTFHTSPAARTKADVRRDEQNPRAGRSNL